MSKPDFADYIYSYFMKYLPLQRGLSQNTISSYSCSLMLFFQYCKSEKGITYEKLTLDRIDKHLIENFLLWLEMKRNNCAASRNQRLSALKSLFQYIQSESVIYTVLCRDIMSIPEKKTPTAPPKYLTLEEMEVMFSMPNIQTSMEEEILCFYYFYMIQPHVPANWLNSKLEMFPLEKRQPSSCLGKEAKQESFRLPLKPRICCRGI